MFNILLPKEIMHDILSYLSSQELAFATQVNNEWHSKCDGNEVWRERYNQLSKPFSKKHFPKPQPGVDKQLGYLKHLYSLLWKRLHYICHFCKENQNELRTSIRYKHRNKPQSFEDMWCMKCQFSPNNSGDTIVASRVIQMYRLSKAELKGLAYTFAVISSQKSVQKKRATYYNTEAVEERSFMKWGWDCDIKLRGNKKKEKEDNVDIESGNEINGSGGISVDNSSEKSALNVKENVTENTDDVTGTETETVKRRNRKRKGDQEENVRDPPRNNERPKRKLRK